MDRWLNAALDYIPTWLDHQVTQRQQPGCLLAIVHRGKVVLETAFGQADLGTGAALTPRHRFRPIPTVRTCWRDDSLGALASAGGFVSTAADTARFFNQLSPDTAKSVLSVASRREIGRRRSHGRQGGRCRRGRATIRRQSPRVAPFSAAKVM